MTRLYALIVSASLILGLVIGGASAALVAAPAETQPDAMVASDQPLAHYPSSKPCRTVTWWDGSWRITFYAKTVSGGYVWITQRHRWLGFGSSHISTTRCWKVYSA
jgi:hypothetical protein